MGREKGSVKGGGRGVGKSVRQWAVRQWAVRQYIGRQ